MSFDAVIFDLDGTLLDTIEDIADTVNMVLDRQGYPMHSIAEYKMMVGLGMKRLVSAALPEYQRDEENVNRMVKEAGREYDRRWKNKSRPYDGVKDMLLGLHQKGIRLAVLSNKPHAFTVPCVEALLPKVFEKVLGDQPPRPAKPAPDGALQIAEDLELSSDQVLYVGDSGTDMKTAKAAGMFAVGVSWGFREETELRENGADTIIGHPEELLKLV